VPLSRVNAAAVGGAGVRGQVDRDEVERREAGQEQPTAAAGEVVVASAVRDLAADRRQPDRPAVGRVVGVELDVVEAKRRARRDRAATRQGVVRSERDIVRDDQRARRVETSAEVGRVVVGDRQLVQRRRHDVDEREPASAACGGLVEREVGRQRVEREDRDALGVDRAALRGHVAVDLARGQPDEPRVAREQRATPHHRGVLVQDDGVRREGAPVDHPDGASVVRAVLREAGAGQRHGRGLADPQRAALRRRCSRRRPRRRASRSRSRRSTTRRRETPRSTRTTRR
jgi:hypothetical protein